MVKFHLNGIENEFNGHPGLTLMEYLRSIELFSVKYGCDSGTCGSCSVLVDNNVYNSCMLLVESLEGKTVETLEHLNKTGEIDDLKTSFLDSGAIQCGYCSPGMLISLVALFRTNNKPDESLIRDALAGNLCRCTGYVKPVEAAQL